MHEFLKVEHTALHSTDLKKHDFVLQEFFHSPKNVLLKALLYISVSSVVEI